MFDIVIMMERGHLHVMCVKVDKKKSVVIKMMGRENVESNIIECAIEKENTNELDEEIVMSNAVWEEDCEEKEDNKEEDNVETKGGTASATTMTLISECMLCFTDTEVKQETFVFGVEDNHPDTKKFSDNGMDQLNEVKQMEVVSDNYICMKTKNGVETKPMDKEMGMPKVLEHVDISSKVDGQPKQEKWNPFGVKFNWKFGKNAPIIQAEEEPKEHDAMSNVCKGIEAEKITLDSSLEKMLD